MNVPPVNWPENTFPTPHPANPYPSFTETSVRKVLTRFILCSSHDKNAGLAVFCQKRDCDKTRETYAYILYHMKDRSF